MGRIVKKEFGWRWPLGGNDWQGIPLKGSA
jgi:hypothetical protein